MSEDEEKDNKGVVIVLHSYAKGNFSYMRHINSFLQTLNLYAVVDNKVLDSTKPRIVLEINILDESQNYIVPKIKDFLNRSKMTHSVKVTVKDKDMPTFDAMAKRFGKALFKTGKNIVKGKEFLVTTEVQLERLDTCMCCDSFDVQKYSCLKCGCNMQAKSVLTSSECPLGKWKE